MLTSREIDILRKLGPPKVGDFTEKDMPADGSLCLVTDVIVAKTLDQKDLRILEEGGMFVVIESEPHPEAPESAFIMKCMHAGQVLNIRGRYDLVLCCFSVVEI